MDLDLEADGQPKNKDKQFLGAVSAFIRRCFECADPDHPSRQAEKEGTYGVAKFALDDDDEEDEGDLMDVGDADNASHPLSPDRRR